MGKVFDHQKAADDQMEPDDSYDPYDDDWSDDWNQENWESELARNEHENLCERVKNGEVEITPELIQSVEDPDWRRELIEAICLNKVNQALKE